MYRAVCYYCNGLSSVIMYYIKCDPKVPEILLVDWISSVSIFHDQFTMDSKEEVNEKPTSEQFALKESEVPLNNTCFIPNESRKYRGGNFLIF